MSFKGPRNVAPGCDIPNVMSRENKRRKSYHKMVKSEKQTWLS